MLYSLRNILNTVEEIAFYRGETPDSCHWSKCKHLLLHVSLQLLPVSFCVCAFTHVQSGCAQHLPGCLDVGFGVRF